MRFVECPLSPFSLPRFFRAPFLLLHLSFDPLSPSPRALRQTCVTTATLLSVHAGADLDFITEAAKWVLEEAEDYSLLDMLDEVGGEGGGRGGRGLVECRQMRLIKGPFFPSCFSAGVSGVPLRRTAP